MIITDKNGAIGRVEVTTLPLPEYAETLTAAYLPSGKAIVFYKRAEDKDSKDFNRVAVVNGDGSNFREIFAGVIPEKPTANGIRHMPFADNKRVLLGDYILEGSPNLDECQNVIITPVEYPWGLESDPSVYKHWSEIIIAPDDEHICWTFLYKAGGCGVGLGALRRGGGVYRVENAKIISSNAFCAADPDRPGYVVPLPALGGEVKQFVRGGLAVSQVGAHDKSVLTDSVIQDLATGEITGVTCSPGYDETAMLSPDERLALLMSTRSSPRTNCAVLGLLPRPHAGFALQGMHAVIYMYAVAGVRAFRKGNIGPVLVEVSRSADDPSYIGVPLNDPTEEWVYCSPMSWHANGKSVMWPETKRGSGERRVRIARLLDYAPKEAVKPERTPDDIPYSLPNPAALSAEQINEGKIAGKQGGYMAFSRREGLSETRYENYSDDGLSRYNGFERVSQTVSETSYEAELSFTGGQTGEMKCRLTFSSGDYNHPPKLLFEVGADGEPKSRGHAEYGGVRLNVADMAE